MSPYTWGSVDDAFRRHDWGMVREIWMSPHRLDIDAAGRVESILFERTRLEGVKIPDAEREKLIRDGLQHWSWFIAKQCIILADRYGVRLTEVELKYLETREDEWGGWLKLTAEGYRLRNPD